MTNITQSIKVILLAITPSFGISYVFAWAPPTALPTNGNSFAPLSTSNVDQTKNGNLFLNALGITNTAAGALSVAGGITLTPSSSGIIFPDGTIQTTAPSVPAADNRVWVGYKWVPNGTNISCVAGGATYRARNNNGSIELKIDTGWGSTSWAKTRTLGYISPQGYDYNARLDSPLLREWAGSYSIIDGDLVGGSSYEDSFCSKNWP